MITPYVSSIFSLFAITFRANKSSNDSRLKVLSNLSAEVRRELGKKVLEAGGNAVLGYSVHFDIEGPSGIVGYQFI